MVETNGTENKETIKWLLKQKSMVLWEKNK